MTCTELRDRFSDYYDGTGEPSFLGDADAHVAGCADCRRYHAVVVEGSAILRGAPKLSVAEDFFPRLQHRIYHIEDGSALVRAERASGSTVSTAVAIAALIAVAAWSPALVQEPEVELPEIVVSRPQPRAVGVRAPQLWVAQSEPSFVSAAERGLWDDPALFTRYSPLMAQTVERVSVGRHADFE
jgi:hypothetical protein